MGMINAIKCRIVLSQGGEMRPEYGQWCTTIASMACLISIFLGKHGCSYYSLNLYLGDITDP